MCCQSKKVPKYCRQKSKNRRDRAYVTIDGKRTMLGAYGSEQSLAKYRELVGIDSDSDSPEAAAATSMLPPALAVPSTAASVSELILVFLRHAEVYYGGRSNSNYSLVKRACTYLRAEAGDVPAAEFGPKALKRCRQRMVDDDLGRKYCNELTRAIVRAFKWAVSEEHIDPSVHASLASVEGLRKGRCNAKETKPRQPVAQDVIDATLEHLPEVPADMVRVQLATGMRPGELCSMRPCDIDRSGDVWVYSPATHKTQHLDKSRAVALGPKAQDILLKYLARADDMHLFRPIDSEAKRLAERAANRVTAKSCGNTRGSNRKKHPQCKPGERYSVDGYRQAIERAAEQAKVERWTPHQLRHTAATRIREKHGLDAAQVVLGHSNAAITQVYAAVNFDKAAEVARKSG